MTEPVFFDTDCLSSFLWVNEQGILGNLFGGRLIVSMEVYNELSNPSTRHLKKRVDKMVKNGDIQIGTIKADTVEYELFNKMINPVETGQRAIGRGEASAIALAKEQTGIVASNNLRDIKQYVKDFELTNLTTADILKEAYDNGLITEVDGNRIWAQMIKRRRKLGYPTFTDFLKKC